TDTETEELYQAILAGQGVNRSPIIAGSASVGSPLIGNTYVEVDLQNQHMYFYKNGDLVLDTDIVSGKPTTLTPPGVNYLWKKERNSILRGTNDDGSKYAEPVDYWMPIDWTGVGIHDSDWQPAYGGELWKTAGSHGCINTPPAVAAKLYEAIDVGTPVLVF
ncbi:L,D-transpeptidase, partial [Vagococcus salmoninarum]